MALNITNVIANHDYVIKVEEEVDDAEYEEENEEENYDYEDDEYDDDGLDTEDEWADHDYFEEDAHSWALHPKASPDDSIDIPIEVISKVANETFITNEREFNSAFWSRFNPARIEPVKPKK